MPSGPNPVGAAPAGPAEGGHEAAAPTGLPSTTGGFRTPRVAVEPEDARPAASGESALSVPRQPTAVGHVGSGPPTYDAEPTALPPTDPDVKLRFWAGRCVRRWSPTADVHAGLPRPPEGAARVGATRAGGPQVRP
ncbi:hypothetical protein AB0885_05035 [Streptomyces sp. NPDC005534]|uniref:hypothetical protein n=1 Tax=Streptomyces sp. NPDC005534 TaxID=3155714 RepID=UPI0034521A49